MFYSSAEFLLYFGMSTVILLFRISENGKCEQFQLFGMMGQQRNSITSTFRLADYVYLLFISLCIIINATLLWQNVRHKIP